MYKTRLQELCHRRMWPAPDYTASRDGPDHNPQFGASVTVNGVIFHAPDLSKSSKEAQNKAAQVAVDHLTASLPPKPSFQSSESQTSFKNQLCIYAQRNNICLPKYDAVREGFAHAPRFKANVTVNGETFSSPQFFNTLKEAENDAARVAASSLPVDENLQDEPNFYKNLLHEMAAKEGICLPKYNTFSKGACHMPVFSSTVEIRGESFVGDDAKTKKQAEMNAAKVAWFKLKERADANSGRASVSSQCTVPAFSGVQFTVTRDLEMPKPLSIPLSYAKVKHMDNSDKRQEDEIIVNNGPGMADMIKDYQDTLLSKETSVYGNGYKKKIASSHHEMSVDVKIGKEITEEGSINQDGNSTPSSLSDFSDHPVADVISESPVGRASSSLLCNRVRVYPRTPNMVLPEGSILLPFSDDTWVAVSLNFTNYYDKHQENGRAIENDSDNSSDVADTLKENRKSVEDDSNEIMLNGNVQADKSDSSLHKRGIEVLSDDGPLSSVGSAFNASGSVNVSSTSPTEGVACPPRSSRVRVYPNRPDTVLPEGATLLPYSDDKWIAVSLDV